MWQGSLRAGGRASSHAQVKGVVMKDLDKKWFGTGIVLACLALVLGPGPAAADDLTSFLPAADAVFIQKTADFPGIGNALLIVQVSDEQLAVLEKETNRTDFVVLGKENNLTILRDDGRGADNLAGDGLFTGVATVDETALNERAETDAENRAKGEKVPVFHGRVAVGTETATTFDAAGFAAGNLVRLTPPVETVDPEPGSEPSGSQAPAVKAVTPGINAFQAKSLMITDLSVVRDPARTFNPCTGTGTPGGVWTFEHLMTSMANQAATGITPSAFVENWLTHSTVTQTINGDTVPPRALMSALINEWRFQSGGGALNLTIAPFRLLAIVARLDLATTRGGGGGYGGTRTGDFLDAGEARFIFGLVLPPGWSDPGFFFPVPIDGGPCMANRMTVIFEYRVPKCKCEEVRGWARQWRNLSTLPFPSATYNRALEAITQQFVPANSNPIKPNGNALGQLRTNEIALDSIWELREFQLTQAPFTFLNETTTADNPEDGHNNNPAFPPPGGPGFLNWVMGPVLAAINAGGIGSPIPPVPLLFGGAVPTNFLGANAIVPNPSFFWHDPGIPNTPNTNESRFRASIASCGGCHAGETLTPFVHVDPATPTGPANLSVFLTGVNGVADPAFGAPARDFDDLARRELDLKRKARMACFRLHPINLAAVRSALSFAKAGVLPDDLFEGLTPLAEHDQIPVAADMLDAPAVSEVH